MINVAYVEKVDSYVRDAMSKGVVCYIGGKCVYGSFYELIVLFKCMEDMLVMCEEMFGFVVAVTTFVDDVEVIRIVNVIIVGLVLYVYIFDVKCMFYFSEKFDFGIVGVNMGVIFIV